MLEGIIFASFSSHTHPIHAPSTETILFHNEKKGKFHYVSGLTRKFMGRWKLSMLFQSVYLWVSLKQFQKLPLTLKTSSTFTYLILNDKILTYVEC